MPTQTDPAQSGRRLEACLLFRHEEYHLRAPKEQEVSSSSPDSVRFQIGFMTTKYMPALMTMVLHPLHEAVADVHHCSLCPSETPVGIKADAFRRALVLARSVS
jgi:hypothetical protein